jgi:hypothetical protein
MARASEFGAVQPDNLRPRRRRDPDDDTPTTPAPPAPAPAAPPAATQPEPAPQPGPTDPTPPPAPVNSAVAHPAPATPGGTLSTVLTAPNHAPSGHAIPEGVAALAGLAAMRRRAVDPMQDWTGDGTRTPRWLSQAIRQFAQLTGRKTQDVQRDALLGVEPIPADILDANWLDCYGYPRDQYDPQAYR